MSNVDWEYTGPSTKYEGDKWIGKLIESPDARVELRKSFRYRHPSWPQTTGSHYSQILVTVRDTNEPQPEVLMSMNGKAPMKMSDLVMMKAAVLEATIELTSRKLKGDV